MSDRFDLEQSILDCWKVTDDIKLLADQQATPNDFNSLATLYDHKFDKLWKTFEDMCKYKQFTNPTNQNIEDLHH